MNRAGAILGESTRTIRYAPEAFVRERGRTRWFGRLVATCLSDDGHVGGHVTVGGVLKAAIHADGRTVTLRSLALDAAGRAYVAAGPTPEVRAYRESGRGSSFVTGVGPGGAVVGESAGRAALWRGGGVIDLNRFAPSPGWTRTRAVGMTADGRIAGIEERGEERRPFLLRPTS